MITILRRFGVWLTALSFTLLVSMEVNAQTQQGNNLSICRSLLVTGNAEYPPILWRDFDNPGKLTGVAVELLELALMGTGIAVDARDRGGWARAQQDARRGEIDMLAGAFITHQREQYMDYIKPQFTDVPSVVWVAKGKEFKYQEWQDLKGKRGGTLINNSFGQAFDQYAKQNLEIRNSASAERSFTMLIAGRFDYALYELYQGLTILESSGFKSHVVHLKTPISVEGLYFTVSKKSGCNTPELRAYLNKRVAQLTEFKTFEPLFEKYLAEWIRQQKAQLAEN
ncbi:transporter substrate-binding domain-containing protein [Motilimonas sp. 1_MG-2023]|uniref:substrate-binding periplasmic protein n=1 Tax=Motilimonas sp. 1_MG-2023 TaxID=3062672 RepID=UPI0026E3F9C6|nr:transporter substrate-binding domain-containing protein [Motilimonas sp. 1_MG-2023]MDO6527320.1 transporter substrate-binding domain-containing protein [Motilimonas sp. 1_MG-2023]